MFRKGGSTNEGITSGLRQGYQGGKLAQVQQDLAILNQLAPAPKPRGSRALNNFLINFGLNLASQSPQGGFLSTAASAAQEPFGRFQQEKMYEGAASDKAASEHRSTVASLLQGVSDDDKNKLWEEAGVMVQRKATNPFTQEPFKDQNEAYDVLIRKSLMSKESLKTDEALFLETKEFFRDNLAQDKTLNNIAIDTVATHEANIVHKRYSQDLIDQLDQGQSYIDSVYVDVDADGNMKLNNIGQNVGYRPNKIYFNISDKSFYKLGADGLTFTKVDIADFQD
tara:strand:- start:488 stop:1333 length:846 start_codon:yes stop_codon:yes gene_type:complete